MEMKTTLMNVEPQPMAEVVNKKAAGGIVTLMNSVLDGQGYRKRFEDLMGARTPQFVSSLVSMVNGNDALQEAFRQSPVTVVQAALKAASYDLPIDAGLGYAYIVPFRNKGKQEAQFILGYKGMMQLALRTNAYKTINVTDVREGELVRYNRLTEEFEWAWVEDDEEREKLPVIGYAGFYRMVNGTEKTIYMSVKAINAHEQKFRKGQYRPKMWDQNFDSMAQKTVLRRLIGKWGLMSIQYESRAEGGMRAAEVHAANMPEGETTYDVIEAEMSEADE